MNLVVARWRSALISHFTRRCLRVGSVDTLHRSLAGTATHVRRYRYQRITCLYVFHDDGFVSVYFRRWSLSVRRRRSKTGASRTHGEQKVLSADATGEMP